MNGRPAADVIYASRDSRADRLAVLFDTHHERLYRLARRLAPSADDALDLVQETFLRAASSAASVPIGSSREEAWLVRVLINLRRDQWRKEAVRRQHGRESRPATEAGTDHGAAVIARATVWRALDRLSPRRRAVVVLHELEGMTTSAIASLLGVTAVTVRWHLSRGRRDLTRVLTNHLGEAHEDGQ
jgi:RNA polymerase sigma-70 factor (ECF subfamily)